VTVEAPSTTAAPARRIPGETGTWVFLFGDMLVFAAFFATFMVERAKAPDVFDTARRALHLEVGLTNTLVLLTSSLFVVVALEALRSGARHIARSAVTAAMACGGVFIALKVFEYHSLVMDGHGVGANHFYLYYFILTGVHLLHVCVGMAVLTFLLTQTRRHELSGNRMAVIEGGACFWHLVDLLWIVLFPLLYLVA
jgi:nitric oxide reductase NorE protein